MSEESSDVEPGQAADASGPRRAGPTPAAPAARSGPYGSGRGRRNWSGYRLVGLIIGATALSLVMNLILFGLASRAIQASVARVYVIPSAAMQPTLEIDDRVLVDKLSYKFTEPSAGDVVVFEGPDSWGSTSAGTHTGDFVKRIIATGGQTVQCCDAQDRILVDGSPLDEPYLENDGRPQVLFGPIGVPEGRLWVMGDNRNNSADSRGHVSDDHLGTIDQDDVIGKARIVVSPLRRWGTVGGD